MADVSNNNIVSVQSDIELTKEDFEIIGCNTEEAEKILRPSITYWQDVWRRFKGNKLAISGAVILLIIILFAILGPIISSQKFDFIPNNPELKNLKPSSKHWFGTDDIGRDIFVRVCVGTRVSLLIGIMCTAIMAVVGSIYGGIAGYYGGFVDNVMMRIVEVISSMPYIILVIIISLIFGRGKGALILAMTLTSWCGTSRMIRGQILQVREQEFVLAAQALGANSSRIIRRHLLPNAFGILMVDITFSVPGFIFSEAFLSYIGLGIQSPDTSLGSLAAGAQGQIMFYAYQLFFPCLFISLIMLSFQIMGDGLNDALDPRMRK